MQDCSFKLSLLIDAGDWYCFLGHVLVACTGRHSVCIRAQNIFAMSLVVLSCTHIQVYGNFVLGTSNFIMLGAQSVFL